MAMLKSISAIALRADSLIKGYHSWQEGPLETFLDTQSGSKTLIELRNAQSNAMSYATQARDLIQNPGFADLDPLVKDDITAIAEEMETGIAEIDDIAHPDNAWEAMDLANKEKVTQRVQAPEIAIQAIRARLKGQKRGIPRVPPVRGPKP